MPPNCTSPNPCEHSEVRNTFVHVEVLDEQRVLIGRVQTTDDNWFSQLHLWAQNYTELEASPLQA